MSDAEKTEKKGFAVAGLVLGIIGICTSFIPIINNVSFFLGILGAIFGIISLIRKSAKGMSIVAVILSILAIVITLQSQKAVGDAIDSAANEFNSSMSDMTGDNTENILKNDVEVTLGDFTATTGEYGLTDTKLTVKVTNKLTEKKSFSIHVEAIDASGNRIGDDYVYANDLGAGQTQSFDIFTLISSDKVDTYKNATFKIVEVSKY